MYIACKFPPKTSKEVLCKVLEAALTLVLGRSLIGIQVDEDGQRQWKGTQEGYGEVRKQAGGVHLLYNPFYEVVHSYCQQQVL